MVLIKREWLIMFLVELVIWLDEWFDWVFWEMFWEYFPVRLDWMFEMGLWYVMHLEEFVEEDICVIRVEMFGLDLDKDIVVSFCEGVLIL